MSTFIIHNPKTPVDRQAFLERCEQGLKERYGDPAPQEARDRLDYELGIIERRGLTGAFFAASEFVAEARRQGVYVAPCPYQTSRLVAAHALGISDADPLEHGLTLDPVFSPQHLLASYDGVEVQLESGSHRSIARAIEERFGKGVVKIEVRRVVDQCVTKSQVAYDADPSTIDTGFVDLSNFQSRFDRMAALCHLVEARTGLSMDPAGIPLDDEAAFELLRSGNADNLESLFAMTYNYNHYEAWSDSEKESVDHDVRFDAKFLAGLPPASFHDLVLFFSCPGPAGARFLDDRLSPALEETGGFLQYREQVLQILEIMGGFSPVEARTILTVFDFGNEHLHQLLEERWCRTAAEKGFSPGTAKRLWSEFPRTSTKLERVDEAVYFMRAAYLKARFPEVWAEAGMEVA